MRRARISLALFVVVTYLPFLNQAFHVDDRIYLEVADHILHKPLSPYDYAPIFEGLVSPDAASHSHLPLVSYYLALLKRGGADREWMFHLAFLVFPLLAVLSFYDLASRYVRFPGMAAALLAVAPAFYVLSHSLMTEAPLLALWLLALSRFVRIAENQAGPLDRWILGLSLLAAAFTSLLSAGLVLLMAIYLWVCRETASQEARRALWSALALPLLLWVAWYLLGYLHYDRLVILNTFLHITKRGGFSTGLVAENVLSFVLNLGAVMVFPLTLWFSFAQSASGRFCLIVLLLSFVPFYIWFEGWSWSQMLVFAVFLSSGLLAVLGMISFVARQTPQQESRRRLTFLWILWCAGVAVGSVILYYSGSVRYLLLALPPVVLLSMAALEERVSDSYFLRNLMWLSFLATAAYSAALAHADYQFAEVYRRLAQEIRHDYGSNTGATDGSSRRVWFTGEWGFRYYMEKAGARILPRTATGPEAGDIIVKPYVASPWVTLYDAGEYTDLLEQRQARIDTPIRLLDFSSHAGFYSTGWGILPFSLTGGEPWEWFNVFQVKKAYSGPIPQQEKHW